MEDGEIILTRHNNKLNKYAYKLEVRLMHPIIGYITQFGVCEEMDGVYPLWKGDLAGGKELIGIAKNLEEADDRLHNYMIELGLKLSEDLNKKYGDFLGRGYWYSFKDLTGKLLEKVSS